MTRLYDPFGSMNGFMSQFNAFRQNPMQMLMQRRMNVPQGMNNPGQIINYLMQNGSISQKDYNNANFISRQFQNNPMFRP